MICQGGARAHLRERRLLASGRAAARAKTPDMSTILMSPSLSGALLTVISRPSYVTLAPTSNDEPCTLLFLTYVSPARLLLARLRGIMRESVQRGLNTSGEE